MHAPDINQRLKACAETAGALLLDVRTRQEYRDGHIPGSRNLPLHTIDCIDELTDDVNTPIYAYCHSGVRSGQAVAELRQMGYLNAENLGGIAHYTGKIEYS